MTIKHYSYNYGDGEKPKPVTINCTPSTLRTLECYQKQQGEQLGTRITRSKGLAMLIKEAERKGIIECSK